MKTMKIIGAFALILSFALMSCEKVPGLSEEEISEGLKEALRVGTDTAVTKLNKSDGFFTDQAIKILLPEEAQPIYNVVSTVPLLNTLIDQTILTINRSAEDAVVEAKPIFVDAITSITLDDALAILQGEDTAATSYLKLKTQQQLHDAFKPKVEASLKKEIIFGISAENSYEKLINTYNSASLGGLLFDRIEENSLSEHTTNKALKGMFVKVGDEETNIRTDVSHRVNETLETVFAELDK